jgi:hypothetical protein
VGGHRDLTDTGALLGYKFDQLSLGQSVAVDLRKFRDYLQCLIENDQLRGEMARRSRERALGFFSLQSVVERFEALWLELGAIADALELRRGTARHDCPFYDGFFGHYASRRLSDSSRIRLTQLGIDCVRSGAQVPRHLAAQRDSILTERVVGKALAELADRVGLEIGGLVRSLNSDGEYHDDYIRRQIMWLIKYGFVEPLVDA